MRKFLGALVAGIMVVTLMPVDGHCVKVRSWTDIVDSNKTWNIYVEDIANDSGNPKVNAEKVTNIVKKLFANRISPKFDVVDDKSKADLVFEGKIIEYIWMKKAPITDIYGGGALAVDIATSSLKKYARMRLEYRVFLAKTGGILLDDVTQVTLKQFTLPEDESYGEIYARAPRILAIDIFKRYEDQRVR